MTDHPQDLLAEYVDGALSGDDLARVESHVSSCQVCREEVALAGRARTALAALPEIPVPLGAARTAVRRARAPRWWTPGAWRVAGAAAAAAAVVAGVVFVSLRSTVEPGSGGPTFARAPAEAPAPGAEQGDAEGAGEVTTTSGTGEDATVDLQLEQASRDHDPQSVGPEARRIAARAVRALEEGFPPTAVEFYAGYDLASLERDARRALSCVTEGSPPDRSVVPFLIQEGTFEDAPSYLVAFLAGPAADRPYDRVQILVVDRASCTIRHFARQNL
jgi:hypothetical protein